MSLLTIALCLILGFSPNDAMAFSSSEFSIPKREPNPIVIPQLSRDAVIYSSTDPQFAAHSARWSSSNAPSFSHVFVPANNHDIVLMLKYITDRQLPMITQGGGHGWSKTLGSIQNGILVNMEKFSQTIYDPTDQTMTIGGAVKTGALINATDAVGREVPVATCPCPGATNVLLGGGHARLQGKYGMVLDSAKSFNMVLANGRSIEVSNSSHPDLFWAMRGAGQNFGVVTSTKLQTYPYDEAGGKYFSIDMIFADQALEEVVEILNKINQNQDPALTMFLVFAADATTIKPFITVNLVYAGSPTKGKAHAQLFKKLNPPTYVEALLTAPELPLLSGFGANIAACEGPAYRSLYSLYMRSLVPSSLRAAYTSYTGFIQANPNAAISSHLYEFYPHQMDGQRPEETAYANRGKNNILALISAIYTDASVADAADAYGKMQRAAFNKVEAGGYEELRIYQNYALGDEDPRSYYGYEKWRLEKLKSVKKRYDPDNVFRGYHDIPL
ncbi:hypothetical protein E2P81_ATG03752 [Venturia nashicola]|uniref:FAD-binding PCMH-type domain-containing protein n=1 Tax=Venturia nashicola TaxID=86259 RepID=A0A4Z1PK27_9PEZI|nr:hypothetical protein E6O75_ATG03839 [Venturia nashicola]TLD38077.1 hypothetical protein E2P81_ATG03752 [Venturia nashicola]